MGSHRVPNPMWMTDDWFKSTMKEYVLKGYKRKEMMNFLKWDFSQYSWDCMWSLDRRLCYFGIYKNDGDVSTEELKTVVGKELKGPGQNFGYRCLHQKLQTQHTCSKGSSIFRRYIMIQCSDLYYDLVYYNVEAWCLLSKMKKVYLLQRDQILYFIWIVRTSFVTIKTGHF